MWTFIHTITVIDSVDPETTARQQRECSTLLHALADAIPCHKCADFYRAALVDMPNASNAIYENMALFRWGWALHNAVNGKLGRPLVNYDDAIKLWVFQ